MAAQIVRKVVGRLLRDDGFKNQVEANPDDALKSFHLTQEERDALRMIDLGAISKTNLQLSHDISADVCV